MLAKYGDSIARRALWFIAPFISLMVIVGVLTMFEHFRVSTQALYLDQISLYVKERVSRERILFQLAESHLNKVQDDFIQRFNSLDDIDYEARFTRLMQKESDGAWRNSPRFADLNKFSGNFIDDETEVTPALKKKLVIFSDITNQYGLGWRELFPNLFIIGQENYMSAYWPEVHWANFADTDINLTQQKNYYHSALESNIGLRAEEKANKEIKLAFDEGNRASAEWTDIYYDNVSSKWLISNINPLVLNQRQVGTIGHDLYLNEIFQRTLNERYPGAFNFIFARSGKVVVYPGLMEKLFLTEGLLEVADVTEPLLIEAFQKIQKGQDWLEYESKKDDYFLVISYLPEPDWFFATAYPKKELTEKALKEAKLVLLLGALLLVVTLLMVYWLLRWQVAKPLQQFIHATHSIADGDRNIYLDDTRHDELGKLANSFLEMQKAITAHTSRLTREIYEKNQAQSSLEAAHHSLQEANDQLELRVLQRTESLKQANDELSSTLNQLQQTQDHLVEAEKMSSLGGLVAGIAHEINTPVGICLTAATSLQDDLSKLKKQYQTGKMTETSFLSFLQQTDECLQMLVANNQRASELIRSFKQVAVDQSSEERRTFILKPYIEEVLLSLQPNIKKTKHHIDLQLEDEITLESYPGALFQVLTNLIMNSLIHGFEHQEKGLIVIAASQQGEFLSLTYQDNGCGMDHEGLQKIFDPFYTTKRGEGGSGLGAHLVYNLVTQQLKGSITCQSEPGQGVRFTLNIPLVV